MRVARISLLPLCFILAGCFSVKTAVLDAPSGDPWPGGPGTFTEEGTDRTLVVAASGVDGYSYEVEYANWGKFNVILKKLRDNLYFLQAKRMSPEPSEDYDILPMMLTDAEIRFCSINDDKFLAIAGKYGAKPLQIEQPPVPEGTPPDEEERTHALQAEEHKMALGDAIAAGKKIIDSKGFLVFSPVLYNTSRLENLEIAQQMTLDSDCHEHPKAMLRRNPTNPVP